MGGPALPRRWTARPAVHRHLGSSLDLVSGSMVPMDDQVLQDDEHCPVELVNGTVRRSDRWWTPAVHHLLTHLHEVGFAESPRVVGFDDEGREMLSFIEGASGRYAGALCPARTRSPTSACPAEAVRRRSSGVHAASRRRLGDPGNGERAHRPGCTMATSRRGTWFGRATNRLGSLTSISLIPLRSGMTSPTPFRTASLFETTTPPAVDAPRR